MAVALAVAMATVDRGCGDGSRIELHFALRLLEPEISSIKAFKRPSMQGCFPSTRAAFKDGFYNFCTPSSLFKGLSWRA